MLLPIVIPLGLIAQVWPGKKTVDRTSQDVIGFIGDFLTGTGGEWDWDEFESLAITDPELDALRVRAARAAPPNADLEELRRILEDAQAIAHRRAKL